MVSVEWLKTFYQCFRLKQTPIFITSCKREVVTLCVFPLNTPYPAEISCNCLNISLDIWPNTLSFCSIKTPLT